MTTPYAAPNYATNPPMSPAVASQATADALAKAQATENGAGRLKLAEKRAARAKALGGRYLEVEGEDGTVVKVPRMAFWDAQTYESYVRDSGRFVTDLETLKQVMPEEDYRQLLGLGLELGDIQDIITEIHKDGRDPESQGSSTP